LIELAVAVRTNAKYKSNMNQLTSFAAMAGSPLNKAVFLRFIKWKKLDGRVGSTGRGYRAAVLQQHAVTEAFPWVDDLDVVKAVAGFANSGKAVTDDDAPDVNSRGQPRRRGSLTSAMANNLFKFITELPSDHSLEYADAFKAMYHAQLRGSHCVYALVGDFQPDDVDDPNSFVLFIRAGPGGDKSDKSGTRLVEKILNERAAAVLHRRTAGRQPRERIFPNICIDVFSDIVKAAAEQFGWPTDMLWDGHVLRVAGSAKVRNELLAVAQRALTQQSDAVFKTAYQPSFAARQKRQR
jgi:hypothetical protein